MTLIVSCATKTALLGLGAKMTPEAMRLHATAVCFEAIGAWYMAEVFQKLLKEVLK